MSAWLLMMQTVQDVISAKVKAIRFNKKLATEKNNIAALISLPSLDLSSLFIVDTLFGEKTQINYIHPIHTSSF